MIYPLTKPPADCGRHGEFPALVHMIDLGGLEIHPTGRNVPPNPGAVDRYGVGNPTGIRRIFSSRDAQRRQRPTRTAIQSTRDPPREKSNASKGRARRAPKPTRTINEKEGRIFSPFLDGPIGYNNILLQLLSGSPLNGESIAV